MAGPLSDYRVLELTSTVSGPMAGMILADQGADIIKIEPPLLGDTARFLGSSREGMGGMFAVLNRNKRSLVLDLKGEEDMAIFVRLVTTADVLLENYRPVNAFSPPDSRWILLFRLPGGRAIIVTPVSSKSSPVSSNVA